MAKEYNFYFEKHDLQHSIKGETVKRICKILDENKFSLRHIDIILDEVKEEIKDRIFN